MNVALVSTRIKRVALFLMLIILAASCDRPECNNTNPVFDALSPEASEYKKELARQLQRVEGKGVSYWFDRYESRHGKDYMLVHVQGENLCGKAFILVNDWGKLQGIRRTEGKGYSGAALKGLQVEIRTDSIRTELIFKDVDYVND